MSSARGERARTALGKKVGIAALQLVDLKARRVVSPERWMYAVELTKLLLDLGHSVEWWQMGNGWCTEIVPGVALWGTLPSESQFRTYPRASEAFLEQSQGVDWAIYFDPILAYPQAHHSSISIDHGAYWDDPMFEASLPTEVHREEWRRRLWSAYTGTRSVVAVDTGVIQWANATWPGMQHRFAYIPNFVPRLGAQATSPSEHETLRVLYPSALVPSEGVSEAVRAMERLLAIEGAYQFYITGSGPDEARQFLEGWAAQHPGVHVKEQPLSDSLLAEVDVVIFPAKSGQGTSIPCLQAMAAGKVVVVAQTGGLTDIILHDHSGIVIQPTTERLVHTLEELRDQPDRRRYLGSNARRVAASFSLERWRERWSTLILQAFGWGGDD